jgi:hypothetical protein
MKRRAFTQPRRCGKRWTQLFWNFGASNSFLVISREIIMLRLIAALGMVAVLTGCAVPPGYPYYGQPSYPDYTQPYYPDFGYGYGYGYEPDYASIGIWGGGGCCFYPYGWYGYGGRYWRGGNGWHGGWQGGWHGGGGHGGGGGTWTGGGGGMHGGGGSSR